MDEKMSHIHVNFTLSYEEYESLFLLYQPLFSYPATSLYLTIYETSKVQQKIELKSLCHQLHISNDELTQYRKELERFNLIRTFAGDQLHISLLKPLAPNNFFAHSTYSRLFTIVMGHNKFIEYSHRYRQEPFDTNEEISENFDLNRLAIWDEQMENMFEDKSAVDSKPSYNVDAFFKRISLRMFPIELRTEKVKELVSEMGTMYGLSFSDLRTALFSATNFDEMHFNPKKFRYTIEKSHGTMSVDDVEDIYDLDPISFLKEIQGDDYVVNPDKNLIKSLIHNFKFNSQVINVLIEYVLKSNDNNLNRSYVEKIASAWKRNKVETKEDAVYQAKLPEKYRKYTSSPKRHTPMPEYSEEIEIDEDVDVLRSELEDIFKGGENE